MRWISGMKKVLTLSLGLGLAVTGSAMLSPQDGFAQTQIETHAGKARINPGGVSKTSRRMYINLDKATIVDLPVDASDVLVANPEIVDAVIKTPKTTYLLGKAVGQTNIFFFNGEGKQLLNLEVCVERDLNPLRSTYRRYMPEARVTVQAIKDNIILSGSVPSATQADKARDLAERFVGTEGNVVNMLTIESGEQVMLKVKVVEMQRSVAKQFGLDFNALNEAGGTVYRLFAENTFSVGGGNLAETGVSAVKNEGDGEFTLGVLQAMERAGMVRTLAEPNLTAITGESANFLAGGEFPVPVGRDRDGNITISFKPFGVGLGFTPVVLGEGRISLRISTEVSELSNENAITASGGVITDGDGNIITIPGLTIPALTVRRAETTVELPSGGSMVIAGLLKDDLKQSIDGIPGVKDMPIIGALARSRDFRSNQSELVIMVTPYLVGPVNKDQLATPTDGFAPPSDADTILLGRLNSVYGRNSGPVSSKKLKGPVGFIVK